MNVTVIEYFHLYRYLVMYDTYAYKQSACNRLELCKLAGHENLWLNKVNAKLCLLLCEVHAYLWTLTLFTPMFATIHLIQPMTPPSNTCRFSLNKFFFKSIIWLSLKKIFALRNKLKSNASNSPMKLNELHKKHKIYSWAGNLVSYI